MQERLSINSASANLPSGVEGHFVLYLYAVVARILARLRTAEIDGEHTKVFEQYPFLSDYQSRISAYLPSGLTPVKAYAWFDAQIVRFEAETISHLPLRALVNEIGLSEQELRLLIAAGIVEEDIRFGALFAALQAPLPARRPCIGMLSWLMSEPDSPVDDIWSVCYALLNAGLLQVDNRADPRSEWVIRLPSAIWDTIRGRLLATPAPDLMLQSLSDFPALSELILPVPLQAHVLCIPDLLTTSPVTALILRGMTGSGRRTLLGSLARLLGRDVLLWEGGTPGNEEWRQLGPLATLIGAMPVLRCNPGPGETLNLPLLSGYTGSVGITLGHSGGLCGSLLTHSLNLTIPSPDREARRRFWQMTGFPIQPSTLDEIADHFLLTGGSITKAASLAHTYALLDDRPAIISADVQQAARTLNRQALETLATRLEPAQGWSDIIVGATIARDLKTLEARCHLREALQECAGPALSHTLNRGVRALFSGPSGTGKTLAARALAAALQMDLYRVDLAAVVNKYIGETERNLNQVLSRAEELDIILLLDEGDALMSSRTEVRNANDRYANLETNYLLQRLENYEGIIVITTNASNRIDTAFARRLDIIIDFVPPEAHERRLIWQVHLPPDHMVKQHFLEEVAGRCALTGGQIRNAALRATVLALDERCSVNDKHLEVALQKEYLKAGASYPLQAKTTIRSQVDQLRQFAADLGQR